MSNELIKLDGAEGRFSRDQIELIKRSFGKGLTDDEVQVFIYTCSRTGLDPMAKQAYAIKRGGVMTIQVGIDGFRLIAERTGCYAPGRETEYGYDANGNLAWARAYVKKLTKDGTWHDVSSTAFRSEYDTGQNLWKKMPHSMLEKCFSSDTEVLTDKGFMLFSDAKDYVSKCGHIMQVTEVGLEPVRCVPWSRSYEGDMIEYDSQYLNFSVTPNHEMVTSVGRCEASVLYAFGNSRNHCEIPHTICDNSPDNPDISDDAIITAAAYLCDGYATSSQCFVIKVSRKKKIDKLLNLNTHFRLSLQSKKNSEIEYGSNNRIIRTQNDYAKFDYKLESLGGLVGLCEKKNVNYKKPNFSLFLTMSARQAKLFVDSMVFFDGTFNKITNVGRFFNNRENLIGVVEVCAIKAGYSCGTRKDRFSDISKNKNYNMTIANRKSSPVFKLSPGHKIRTIFKQHYHGDVWCVTVPSSTIVVRKNGFSMVCGNCAESKALRKCFPSDLSGLYTREEMDQAEEVEVIDMTKKTISQEDWDKMDAYLNGHMDLREKLKKLCRVDNLRNITYSQLDACRRLAHEYISNLKQIEQEEPGDAE